MEQQAVTCYNNIIENGNYNATSGGCEWQFHSAQHRPGEAEHNYWGAGMNSSTIDASIYDTEGGWGEVEFYPFETEPVQCHLTPEEPPAFTTTRRDRASDRSREPRIRLALGCQRRRHRHIARAL